MPGLYFEDYKIGQTYRHHLSRTVTETDNLLFTSLTMSTAPLHLDVEYAKSLPYGRQIVTSIFTIGVVIGMSLSELFEGTSLGTLGITNMNFPAPVFIGDTLRAETELLSARDSRSHPGAGIISVIHRGYKQDDTLVVQMQRTALSMKRPAENPV